MKKFSVILSTIMVSLMVVCFTACVPFVSDETIKSEIATSNNDVVVIKAGLDDVDKPLIEIMQTLKGKNNFTFESVTGPYGEFITSVNGRSPVKADYWAVYTSDTANGSADYGTYDYNGTTLVSASLGVSSLKVVKRGIYALVYTAVPDAEVISTTEDQVIINVNFAEENQTLFDVMSNLKNESKLKFTYENSIHGPFITSINQKVAEGNNFWAFYTTDNTPELVNTEYTIEINGTTYYSCNFGVSSMPVKAWAQYAIVYSKF